MKIHIYIKNFAFNEQNAQICYKIKPLSRISIYVKTFTSEEKTVKKEKWIEEAWKLKRDKGISWTKLPGELEKETGIYVEAHKIRDAVRSYEQSNGIAPSSKPECSIVLNISDIHVGKQTESFNFDKLTERVYYMFTEAANEVKTLKKLKTVNAVHLNFIGDIIDNDSLYPTQPHHVDHEKAGHATKQIKVATQLFTEAIKSFYKEVKVPIVVNAVKGNHGRISKFTNESNNYDIMFYNSLEISLDSNKWITFNISNDFYNLVNIENHGFLLNHGNGVKMYQNIPWYGLVQRCMRWAGSMSQSFDYMIVGHFHTNGEQEWNDKIIFMNGTAVTDDKFGLEFLGLSSSNNMWLFGVSKDKGIEYRSKINLGEV